jgi:superoxide dismutase, Fe-Mn family
MERRDFLKASGALTAGLVFPFTIAPSAAAEPASTPAAQPVAFTLPPLPYAVDALEPHLTKENLELHHGKHHNAYVVNLNKLIDGKPEAGKSLEEIILSSEGPMFNNAAQIWNHTFYWNSMSPKGGGEPTGDLAAAIIRDFGAFAKFKEEFTAAAIGQFGSGWAWLVSESGKLKVTKTGNADLPLKYKQTALLTIDVWEHAYYPTFKNLRPKYIDVFLASLANWEFAAANFAKVK